ncbi:hypothetical protein JCM10908_003955 [Rhodotorula pacifica]|uniref:uncharacterized protein n=1 Tax=Rhodotorula pacifica TaxID=1495444 RepID=UPI00317AF4E4
MASSRLKRKIEVADEGQYGNLNESFVSIGTALPALTDHKKDKNEFKPVWDQEVYDEQGRRRFHGAFTGGFSAGYYNSVGSKEGWKPSTFKSSRSSRASQQNRSVADAAKDFMDEEDLAELASSRTIETSSSYASSSRAPPPPKEQEYDPLLGLFGGLTSSSAVGSTPSGSQPQFDQTLASLVQPSSSRIGLKLMRKMGWREGQGVGPRVSYQQRKRQAAEIGIRLGDEDGDEEVDGEATKHYYAPLDRPLTLVKGSSASKDKGWGLGYQPGMGLKETLRAEGGFAGSSKARTMTYELDDNDVYGDSSSALQELSERQKRTIGTMDQDEDSGFTAMRSSRDPRDRQPRPRKSVPQDEFSDGTRLLPGFVLHRETLASSNSSQLPPSPPAGWQPDPTRLWKENQPPSNENGKGKGRQLDAEDRGSLLGEKAPPPMPKSVFDYLSAKSRERLATLTAPSTEKKEEKDASAAAPRPPSPKPDVQLYVPPLDRPTANAALRGFQPYSSASTSPDPIKQTRYTLYLQYEASENASTTSSPFGPRVLPNGKLQTIEELNRELFEYSQAARVFKPVSGMLGNRFQSSQSGSLDIPKAEPGLYQPPPKAETSKASLADKYVDATAGNLKPPEPELTPAQQAARAGNFGPLTRTTTVFRPARLLCKRFGVRDPHEARGDEGGAVGGKWGEATASGREFGAGAGQPIGQSAIDEMMQSSGFRRFQAASKEVEEDAPEVAKGTFETPAATGDGNTATGTEPPRTKNKPPPTLETVGYGDDESQGQEIVAEQRAPADIFAAIFADSDDDDSDDDEDDDRAPVIVAPTSGTPVSTTINVDPYAPKPAAAAAPTSAGGVEAAATAADEAKKVSLDEISSYRPSFVPAASKSTTDKEKSSSRSKKKLSSSSKRKSGALSFDLEEGVEEDGAGTSSSSRKKSRKDDERAKDRDREERKKRSRDLDAASSADPKRKRSREEPIPAAAAAAGDDEWEEAAPSLHPDVLKAMQQATAHSSGSNGAPSTSSRARPRAADLY